MPLTVHSIHLTHEVPMLTVCAALETSLVTVLTYGAVIELPKLNVLTRESVALKIAALWTPNVADTPTALAKDAPPENVA